MQTPKLEELMRLLWTQQLYEPTEWVTSQGEPLRILQHGRVNSDESGIEILDAQIEINDRLLSGPIAVHTQASLWRRHLHQMDSTYDPCILHLVLENDSTICRIDGSVIPSLTISLPEEVTSLYDRLIRSKGGVLCGHTLAEIKPVNRYHFLTRWMIERLERKYSDFLSIYKACDSNWNEVFFIMLFRTMGGDKNREAYMTLARKVTYSHLSRIKESPLAVEALLLGSAGWLDLDYVNRYADGYTVLLQKEFDHLRRRFNITPMRPQEWVVAKNNPNNHPIIRIAELASLLHSQEFLFSKLLACETLPEMHHILRVEASEYWSTHSLPSKPAPFSIKRIGAFTLNSICINLVVPMMFTYGKTNDDSALQERALEILEHIPPEKNRYIVSWQQKGVEVENAFFSQALLQLSREYCERERCALCDIGKILLCS